MSYKTVVLDHASKTKDMASAVEHKANEIAEKGFLLLCPLPIQERRFLFLKRRISQ